jgi:hypothetical protein
MGGYESISEITASDALGDEEKFYKAIVGSKSQDYYLNHFAQFHSHGKTAASWHWSAFFLTFSWLLYRKMWLNAFLYLLLCFLILLMDAALHFGFKLYLMCIFILPSIYANALYYNHCKERILSVKASSLDLKRQLNELSGKGGTSLIIALIVPFILFIWFLITTISHWHL